MRCDIPIMITDELRLTVTGFYHSPMQKMSYNCEYLPEYFEVEDGYLEDVDGNDFTGWEFWEAVDENRDVVLKAVREYFYQGVDKGELI